MLTNNIVNGMFDNLKKENPSKDHTYHDSPTYYNELVSLKVETTDKKVMLGTNTLAYAFDPTGDAVRNQYWFNKLVSIDLSGLDTSSVTNMAYMFAYCLFKTSQKLYNLVRHCL